jgi:hypothetical protein
VHESINFVSSDAWLHRLTRKAQNFGSNRTSVAHALNNFW